MIGLNYDCNMIAPNRPLSGDTFISVANLELGHEARTMGNDQKMSHYVHIVLIDNIGEM